MVTTMVPLNATSVITSTSAPTMGYFNRYNATSGGLTVTLPALSGLNVGARCAVQKYSLDISANIITFNCAGSDKFDDATTTSFTLNQTGDQREIQVVSISGTKRWKFAGTLDGSDGSAGDGPIAVFYIDDYLGADHTGATFSDTAVNAAITAMGTSPGIIEFGSGTYKLNTTKTLAYPGQGIKGQGLGTTIIDYRGTGDCLRVWDSTVATTGLTLPGNAGPITGITLYGWNNSNSNISGLHIGDLGNIFIQNVSIVGFNTSGSKCFWGENRYSWSERAFIQMETGWAPDNYLFETNASHPIGKSSWSYSTFKLVMSADPNQNGARLKNNVNMVGVDFTLWGNCFGHATANTGVTMTIGTTGTDTSFISGNVTIMVESIGNPTIGHKDINIGAAALLLANGALIFNNYEAAFVAGTATPATAQFAGRINCPSLGAQLSNESFRVAGGARFKSTPSAVNYSVFEGAATGNWPAITAAGTDTDVGLMLNPQAAGPVRQYVNTQTQAILDVSGTQTNIDYNIKTKGTGVVKANNVAVVTASGATSLPLTSPKINSIKDTNGNTVLDLGATASAANYVYVANAAAGGTPAIGTGGTDTNVNLHFFPQGTGRVTENGNILGSWVSPPASHTATGKQGQMAADATALYICYGTNLWGKIAGAGWTISF